jgi:hypothetical protein
MYGDSTTLVRRQNQTASVKEQVDCSHRQRAIAKADKIFPQTEEKEKDASER